MCLRGRMRCSRRSSWMRCSRRRSRTRYARSQEHPAELIERCSWRVSALWRWPIPRPGEPESRQLSFYHHSPCLLRLRLHFYFPSLPSPRFSLLASAAPPPVLPPRPFPRHPPYHPFLRAVVAHTLTITSPAPLLVLAPLSIISLPILSTHRCLRGVGLLALL
ncbi:hypothetical protein C8J57DRAFT_184545 [Mycena rebaudengoi]|nr:hypothetical protein C8J57DRAFT_184545 [Mycena rebaudengoi]